MLSVLRITGLVAGAGMTITLCGQSAVAEENLAARNSAAFLYGQIVGNLTILGQCAESDRAAAPTYVDATEAYFRELRPVTDRIEALLREEGLRSGKGPGHFLRYLPIANDEAKKNVKQMRDKDPAAFIVTCRATLKLVKDGALGFVALAQRYPSEMRAVEQWR